jgi:hypothetical protein
MDRKGDPGKCTLDYPSWHVTRPPLICLTTRNNWLITLRCCSLTPIAMFVLRPHLPHSAHSLWLSVTETIKEAHSWVLWQKGSLAQLSFGLHCSLTHVDSARLPSPPTAPEVRPTPPSSSFSSLPRLPPYFLSQINSPDTFLVFLILTFLSASQTSTAILSYLPLHII